LNETTDIESLNADELLADWIRVDKTEAARRQLDSFIEMFLQEEDVVSQHTLVMAAHTVLYDIAQKRGIGGSMREPGLGTDEEKRKFVDAFRLPENFFKHADRDPDAHQKFFPAVSHFVAMDAARLYILLGNEATLSMKVFLMWFQLRYPSVFKFEPAEEELKELRTRFTSPAALKAFAKQYLAHHTAGGKTSDCR
jgi:hypothetical protein